MKAVVNTTVIIGLAKINCLDILKGLFEEVSVSQGVYEEIISGGKGKYGVIEIKKSGWIKTKEIKNMLAVRNLELDLDTGESETIVLAQELGVDYVILDDERAREAARCLNLKVLATIGLLVKAKKNGLVKKIKPHIDELRKRNFWISEDLYMELLNLRKKIDGYVRANETQSLDTPTLILPDPFTPRPDPSAGWVPHGCPVGAPSLRLPFA